MAKGSDVLEMLCSNVEWTIYGDDYDSIIWHNGEPAITKKQFTDGFSKYDAWKIEQDAIKAQTKTNLLERLGITEDEAKLLLS